MGPVVGLDVSKRTSMLQAFTDRNKPYGQMVSISHTQEGFERLGDLLEELVRVAGIEPVVVFEATGHYHRSLNAYCLNTIFNQKNPRQRGFFVVLIKSIAVPFPKSNLLGLTNISWSSFAQNGYLNAEQTGCLALTTKRLCPEHVRAYDWQRGRPKSVDMGQSGVI